MGNKVNPIGMRLQVNRTWDSRWYADTKDYGNLLLEDVKIREFIKEECKQAGVSRVVAWETAPGDEHWTQSIEKSRSMLHEAGIEFVMLPKPEPEA